MKVKKVSDCIGVDFPGGKSYRPVLASDNMGFSVHKTVLPKGPANRWHYTHHFESCYCIQGRGILTNLSTGEQHEIVPDTVYLLDNHDDHTFEPLEDTVLISVFNPPCTGFETHDENGHYKIDKPTLYQKSKEIAKLCYSKQNIYDAAEAVADYLTINR